MNLADSHPKITDPDPHSTQASDIYANIPLNVNWIRKQIELQPNRKKSKGFTNRTSVFVIFCPIYFLHCTTSWIKRIY